ncbi:hypothetical protein K505DRAFT_320731 [Melanomma pulvis-pyrius CBS 109.77]|uniref:Uncharacterized protein n=1 Tax=Melanomma pulvis-pyrius CBS 109.77 TaxID=1314802 RepID=A0A6A6XVP5_9PLEO|nr:hypothetical protein K505DRAFT_320731 [Melanomma pulvis-pyrius CBS 109.77]
MARIRQPRILLHSASFRSNQPASHGVPEEAHSYSPNVDVMDSPAPSPLLHSIFLPPNNLGIPLWQMAVRQCGDTQSPTSLCERGIETAAPDAA